MILKEYPPGPAPRGTIRVYRVVHVARDPVAAPAVMVFPPVPEQCLQLFVHEPEVVEYPDGRRVQCDSVIAGSHDLTVKRIVPPRFLMIQAVFEPGALYRLTGIPGTELQNAYLDAESVLGPEIRLLREVLRETTSYAGMVAHVDRFVQDMEPKRKSAHAIHPWLRLMRDRPELSIDEAAARSSLSLRQFERTCRQHTGMGPRELASIARFDRAFHIKLHQPQLDWLSIAIACGYYDYQHMARDFRSFSGLTPPRLLDTQRSSPEHLLGVRHEFDLSYTIPAGG